MIPSILSDTEISVITPFILQIIKWSIVIFLIGYLIFAAVIMRQVKLMIDTIRVGFETQIKILAVLPMILGVLILIFALIL